MRLGRVLCLWLLLVSLVEARQPAGTLLAEARTKVSIKACSLCREIPRLIHRNDPQSVPECARHLGPFDRSGQKVCPECGVLYRVTYETTHEDMSFWEDVEIVRDVSALAQPELLYNSEPYLRHDAAFALARAGRPDLAWSHPDPLVRRSAVQALDDPADLRFLLQDEDGPTRLRAARLSLDWVLENRDSPAMLSLLQSQRPDVRQMAIAYLRHGQGLDAAQLAPVLEHGCTSEELAGLEWLALQGYQPQLQLQRLLEASKADEPETRKAAISALDGLQSLWDEAVLLRFLELLKSDPQCRYWVLVSLRKLGAEAEMREFLPVLADFLATENFPHFPEVAWLLLNRIRFGEGSSEVVHSLAAGLKFQNSYQRRLVGDCYRALLAAGLELGPAQEVLVQVMSAEHTDIAEDQLVPSLTGYLLRHQRWAELERLLRGGSSLAGHVPWCCPKIR